MYSGRSDGIHRDGVALFYSKRAATALIEWEPIDERLMVARFDATGTKMSIIMCYAPTEVTDDEVEDAFYRKLIAVFKAVPRHDTVMIIVDMNAKVGTGVDGVNRQILVLARMGWEAGTIMAQDL